ncbi:MAG: AtpZ/AtpI family protein [Flavobacteriales bacterium]|nr:AtpZ/AtpI family protein [Flavobacteriales bacterium]
MKNNQPLKKPKPRNNYLRFSGVAIQMGAIIGLGAWAGSALDAHYQITNKLFTISVTLLAVAISMYLVIKEVINMSKDDDK